MLVKLWKKNKQRKENKLLRNKRKKENKQKIK